VAAPLHIWMNGLHVGEWHVQGYGTHVFRYDSQWTRSPMARVLSLSLPITAGSSEHRGDVVANYFDNLLPDSLDIRNRLSTRFSTKSNAAFDLLTAIGRDCVGAVQMMPDGAEPEGWNRIDAEQLSDAQVARILTATTSDNPLGQRDASVDDFRISIAGAQEKTALLRFGGAWYRPHGATPTSHILKLPLGLVGNMRYDLSDSVENEWLCAQIMRELGLPVADTEMATFGSQKTLVVRRFDRRWQGIAEGEQDVENFIPPVHAWIARLPQEDFCQATGKPPRLKYEADGGPSMEASLTLLAGSERADDDRTHFVLAQLAFWLLAATDGHAKNFSLFHRRGGTYGSTPLYDVISAWPIIGEGPNLISEHDAKLAMALHSKSTHYKLCEIRVRHWLKLARDCGVRGVWEQMTQLVTNVDTTLQRVQALLPNGFPARVWDPIERGMKRHARQFSRELELLDPQEAELRESAASR
jgi:serine/threonine-protein kinase HipA